MTATVPPPTEDNARSEPGAQSGAQASAASIPSGNFMTERSGAATFSA